MGISSHRRIGMKSYAGTPEASWRSRRCVQTLPTNTARHRVSESLGNEFPGWHIRSMLKQAGGAGSARIRCQPTPLVTAFLSLLGMNCRAGTSEASWRSRRCVHTLPTNTARHRVSEYASAYFRCTRHRIHSVSTAGSLALPTRSVKRLARHPT